MDWKKLFIIFAILALFHFYYTYFHLVLELQRRLEPWKRALKRIK